MEKFKKLKDELREELKDNITKIKKVQKEEEKKYRPNRFNQMISNKKEDIVDICRKSVKKDNQIGLQRLEEIDCLDFSLEETILRPKYKSLFSEEILYLAKEKIKEK